MERRAVCLLVFTSAIDAKPHTAECAQAKCGSVTRIARCFIRRSAPDTCCADELHPLFDRKKVLESQYVECADIVLVERQGTLAKIESRIQLRA